MQLLMLYVDKLKATRREYNTERKLPKSETLPLHSSTSRGLSVVQHGKRLGTQCEVIPAWRQRFLVLWGVAVAGRPVFVVQPWALDGEVGVGLHQPLPEGVRKVLADKFGEVLGRVAMTGQAEGARGCLLEARDRRSRH